MIPRPSNRRPQSEFASEDDLVAESEGDNTLEKRNADAASNDNAVAAVPLRSSPRSILVVDDGRGRKRSSACWRLAVKKAVRNMFLNGAVVPVDVSLGNEGSFVGWATRRILGSASPGEAERGRFI